MIYKTKRFSSKTWEGIKGGLKGAGSGAKWGAILAPGNLTAAAMGKPKIALGLTGAGAAIGAYIGGKSGYQNAVNSWKYKNDPEYTKKIDLENKNLFEKKLKFSIKRCHDLVSEYKLQDWVKLSDKIKLPGEIVKYVKFYNTWSKNIDRWYNNLILPKTDYYDGYIPEFNFYFPVPMDAKNYLNGDPYYDPTRELEILTTTDYEDENYICYSLDKKLYGIDFMYSNKSLKELLYNNIDPNMKLDLDFLGPENIRLIQDFKRHL